MVWMKSGDDDGEDWGLYTDRTGLLPLFMQAKPPLTTERIVDLGAYRKK